MQRKSGGLRAIVAVIVLIAAVVFRTMNSSGSNSSRANATQPTAARPSSGASTAGAVTNGAEVVPAKYHAPEAGGEREACIVTTVHDGDTFRCRGDVRVRLLLVDAPELDQPNGPASRDALKALVKTGDTVWLEYDVARTDQYGRTLAYVWTAERGGVLTNLSQAQNGWATVVVFPPNVKRVEVIRSAVRNARAAHLGMWATGQVCEPIEHKKGHC